MFNQCVAHNTPTPLLDELFACWRELVQRGTMGENLPNELPTDDSRVALTEAIKWAMSEYSRLGAIWKAR